MRFHRTLFTAPVSGDFAQFVAELAGEEVELVLDARPVPARLGDERLRALCEEAEMYYVPFPQLPEVLTAADPAGERNAARAATLALRHSACLVAPEEERQALARTVAAVAGMRVIDLATSPAAIALGRRPAS